MASWRVRYSLPARRVRPVCGELARLTGGIVGAREERISENCAELRDARASRATRARTLLLRLDVSGSRLRHADAIHFQGLAHGFIERNLRVSVVRHSLRLRGLPRGEVFLGLDDECRV